MPIRYIIAIVLSCSITAAGFGISQYLRKTVIERIRQSLHAAGAEGTLPKELEGQDLDQVALEGFDVKLPDNEFRRLMIADLIRGLWFVWVPVVFAISIAVVYFTAGPAESAR